jgi:hypothetical protein
MFKNQELEKSLLISMNAFNRAVNSHQLEMSSLKVAAQSRPVNPGKTLAKLHAERRRHRILRGAYGALSAGSAVYGLATLPATTDLHVSWEPKIENLAVLAVAGFAALKASMRNSKVGEVSRQIDLVKRARRDS